MRRIAIFIASVMGAAVSASAPVVAQTDKFVPTPFGMIAVQELARGLDHPWGMAFLPDGRLLVTERAGTLRMIGVDGRVWKPLAGTPEVFVKGSGGLLDVALDPAFSSNRLVYLSFAEPSDGGASTALGRGRLQGTRIEGFEVIFRQQPKVSGALQFGGRIVFSPQGKLFLTLGEHHRLEPAQDLSNHLGKIIRINRDGSVPPDNPFVGRADAKPEIWSYGHRNVESAAINPRTGALWIAEMGPRGGDELNRPEPGRNYGWPVVSWGEHYDGTAIPDPPTHPRFADAIKYWTPVISPSGMVFYTGAAFHAWRGSLLIGGLSAAAIVRVKIDGERVTGEERIPLGARIRDVEQAPDGSVYVLTDQDDGKLWRLSPEQSGLLKRRTP